MLGGFVVAGKDILHRLFGVHVSGELRLEVPEHVGEVRSRNVVVGDSCPIHLLALKAHSGESEVVADVVPESRQEVSSADVSEVTDLRLQHRESCIFGGNPIRGENTQADATAHDVAVPVRDLQGLHFSELVVQGELLPEEILQ